MRSRGGNMASFILQTIVMVIALLCAVGTILDGGRNFGAIIFLFMAEFVMGILQLILAIINAAGYKKHTRRDKNMILIYWVAVAAFAFGGLALIILDEYRVMRMHGDFISLYLGLAWGIAIYFYVVTIIQTFGKKQNHPPIPGIDLPGYDQYHR